jgi:hypothetical protein
MTGESGFYRLSSLKPKKDFMIESLKEECGNDCDFAMRKVREFLPKQGDGADFSFIKPHLQDMVDTY